MSKQLLRERYEPLEVVGRGGEGEVTRALDQLHSRYVALKSRTASGETSRTELLSEARLLLSLSPHPGLPLVREDFFVDDRYVIAMDWIDGTDLDVLLRSEGRPGLDPELAIGYLQQAAEALEHLHAHVPRVVHGDVKPANLILTASGRIVLVDFGLSSLPADDVRRAGTAGFVAPEVAAGERPTGAADVYSLAATALALFTGQPPNGDAPSWGTLERERIPALERIVRSNLAVDPSRRDASAIAFVARLRRWWGADLPRGTATLVSAELSSLPPRSAEDVVDEVASTHGGCCIPPADDGPLLAAFASPGDGLEAAIELARRYDARVAAVTGECKPAAGTYRGEPRTRAALLLHTARDNQVLVDDRTAHAVGAELPNEVGLAETSSGAAGAPGWAVVAPGLSVPPRALACPYRGLMAFDVDDGDVFFGREGVVASILERIGDGSFLAVVGASGSGKSSLVRAGVVPAFRKQGDAVVAMTPGPDPPAELARSLVAGRPALLVVDQFEEAFTLCTDDEQRGRFFAELLGLCEAGSTSVVIAVRADFYGRCAEHAALASAVAAHQHLLGPMRPDELRRAIDGPARAAGLRFEPGLVDSMLADVEGEPGALPLLSHVLYESWSRRDGQVVTWDAYGAAGGVRGAIAATAEDVFLRCSASEQVLLRQLFLRLTELGDGTEDSRRRVPRPELGSQEGDDGAAGVLLDRLAGARLIVVSDDSIEIAHEALIREWPRLRGWLAEDRDELRALGHLATAARTWDETGRHDADLYRGPRLAAAAHLSRDDRQLTRVERDFLDASRGAQEDELRRARDRARRLRALLAVVAAALVVAAGAGAFALIQRADARHTAVVAEAGRLAAQSREVAAQHPDLGLLLALEADELDDSDDSRSALLGALQRASRINSWLRGFTSPVNGSVFSPNGELLATVTQRGTSLWDTRTWRPVGTTLRSSQGDAEGVDFSPDGRMLAISGAEGRVELWDVSTRTKLRDLTDPAAANADDPALASVRFSPDGRVVAAGGLEANHVTVWAVATGRVIGRPITTNPRGSGAHSIAFTPDSKRIAVPGAQGTVGVWDVATGRRVGRPLVVGSGSAYVEAVIFAEDGRALVVSDDSGSVAMVDAKTGRAIRPSWSVGDEPAGELALSPDGRLLAAASYRGSVFVWDVSTGAPHGPPLTADSSPVNDVSFSPDGRMLVSSHLRSAVVWDLSGEQNLGRPVGSARDVTTDVSFSGDGAVLVSGQLDGDVLVYDTATRRRVRRIEGDAAVTAVDVRPDGRLIAVGTIDGEVRLLDRTNGSVVGALLDADDAAVWQVAFSPDGERLAVAVDPNGVDGFYLQQQHGMVELWDVSSRRRLGRPIRPGGGSVLAIAFSADGALLATGSYFGRLDLWDVDTHARRGKPMKVADDGVLGVAVEPGGRVVAAGGATGPTRVWRIADRRPAFPPLTGHTAPVTGVAFDPDGAFLATTTVRGATRLWDPVTGLAFGDELAPSPRPGAVTSSLALPPFLPLGNEFSPNGRLLAVSGGETLTMLWDVDPKSWRERACAVVGRNLSSEEWKLYRPGAHYRATCTEWPT